MAFDQSLLDASVLVNQLLQRLGPAAPRCRYLHLEYCDSNGTEFNRDAIAYQVHTMSDEALIQMFCDEYAKQGFTMLTIVDVEAAQLIYLHPPGPLETARPLSAAR